MSHALGFAIGQRDHASPRHAPDGAQHPASAGEEPEALPPMSIQPNMPPRYLRTPEAARFLGLSGRTLEKHRTYGTGPKYSKIGGRVVYRLEDLQAWVSRGNKMSTSDDTGDVVLPAKRHAAVSPAYAGRFGR